MTVKGTLQTPVFPPADGSDLKSGNNYEKPSYSVREPAREDLEIYPDHRHQGKCLHADYRARQCDTGHSGIRFAGAWPSGQSSFIKFKILGLTLFFPMLAPFMLKWSVHKSCTQSEKGNFCTLWQEALKKKHRTVVILPNHGGNNAIGKFACGKYSWIPVTDMQE